MDYEQMKGKTIAAARQMRHKSATDDTGYLRLDFTDGSFLVIAATYGHYDQSHSCRGEYPTDLYIENNTDKIEQLETIEVWERARK
jgi:hypothetical protein